MLREELKRIIEHLEEDIETEKGRGWECNKELLANFHGRLDRIKQLYSDLDY